MYTITASFDLNRGLRSNYISAFIAPSDGSFWVITWGGGLYKVNGDFINTTDIYFEYVADFNTDICTSDKNLWIENNNKIYSIDLATKQINELTRLNKFIGNKDVNSMLVSSKGYLWIGLSNQLLKYNAESEQISVFDIITGKDSWINNLIEDFNGNIWGTTLTSIFKFSASNNQIESFPGSKGIPLDIYLSQSIAKSESGEIFIGGNDGYISFNPQDISKNLFFPRTVISGVKIDNKTIDSFSELNEQKNSKNLVSYSSEVILNYDQRSISIGFSSLHMGDPDRNLYTYRLEGFENKWNFTSGIQNFATYSNLKPGKYIFRVKGTNNDGVWFNNEATLQITLNPPFWASDWALMLYIATFLVILTMLFFTIRNRIRFKAEIHSITIEKEKSEELALAKQSFFTNISHEFRTPLNLIIGPVQTILDRFNPEPNARILLQMVMKNARRLLSLVNQLMDIRKIENKTLKLNLQQVDIVAFCHEQFDLFSEAASSQNIDFRFEAPDIKPLIITDTAKLESIVQNLLSNAFKFTPHKGQIIFSLQFNNDKKIRITVSDSGIGILPNEQGQIFNRYYQGSNSMKKQFGYGIGLNLAKEYCELMGGIITFESQPGKGTEFRVELPLNDFSTNDVFLPAEVSKVISSVSTSHSKEKVSFISNENLPVLLLVDDNPDTLEFIKISLDGKFQFMTSQNGKEALKILEKNKIDLIISDVMMPEINGLSLCEQVKTNPKYDGIPVILITAMTQTSYHIEGYRTGADDYLIKPFNAGLLEARINSLIYRTRKIEDYIKQKMIVGNQDVEVESYSEKLLQEAIKYINEHLSDPEINIDTMCKDMGISHSNLYRKIKTQTGLTINELIRQVKLRRAAQLIKNKKMTIAEIMDVTGFTNHSYFAKCFKKEYGMSPREWAEKN